MPNATTSGNIRLGGFVLTGLLLLILLLFLIGKNRNLWGAHFVVNAIFKEVNGLEVGNNVRFAGINAGTVESIDMINDTAIKVSMSLKKEFEGIIHNNAMAGIGTDGLVGNKVVNIISAREISAITKNEGFIRTHEIANTDEMLKTLSISNENVKKISDTILIWLSDVRSSRNIKYFLHNDDFRNNIHLSIDNWKQTTEQLNKSSLLVRNILQDVATGKGNVGKFIRDTAFINDMETIAKNFKETSYKLNYFIDSAQNMLQNLKAKTDRTNNSVGLMLNDSATSENLSNAIENFNLSVKHFNENMIALQHSIFFRKYFKNKKKPTN